MRSPFTAAWMRRPAATGVPSGPAPRLARTTKIVLATSGLDEYVFGALRSGASAFLLEGVEADPAPWNYLKRNSGARMHPRGAHGGIIMRLNAAIGREMREGEPGSSPEEGGRQHGPEESSGRVAAGGGRVTVRRCQKALRPRSGLRAAGRVGGVIVAARGCALVLIRAGFCRW